MSRKTLFGSRAFYRQALTIAIPIIVQSGISIFVSLLDNIMVGQVGTLQMSGVSVANQLIQVFNICIFGAVSGAGIFTAQFHGSGDQDGIRYSFRYKLVVCLALVALGCTIFLTMGPQLIHTFLQGEGSPEDARQILSYGMEYLKVMLLGFFPFAFTSAYCGTLRECGKAVVPMIAGIIAVVVNLALNYILIFGHLGFQAMGVVGAAVATVVARYVELAIVMVYSHSQKKTFPYLRGLYRTPYIPGQLVRQIALRGTPLLINEFLWSVGVALLNQSYSTCGLDVVPALNITATLDNLANVVTLAIGNTVGIIMGQMMGANRPEEEIRTSNRHLTSLSILCGVIFGGLLAAAAFFFPRLYNTTPQVMALATSLILILALIKPFQAYLHCAYNTLRSGGKTLITLLYDGGFMWMVSIPLAVVLSRLTNISILPLYAIVWGADLIKVALGAYLIHKGTWIHNLAAGRD